MLHGYKRIMSYEPHLHPPGTPGHLRTDVPQSDDTKSLTTHFGSHEVGPTPLPGFEVGIGLRYVPRQSEHEGDGMLRGRNGIAGGSVYHDYTLPRRLLDIDIVDADPGPTDYLQLLPGPDQLGGYLHLTAHYQGFVVAYNRYYLIGRQPGPEINVGVAVKNLQPFSRNILSDQYFQLLPPLNPA